MVLQDLLSEERIMQISTKFANIPDFEKHRSDAIAWVKKSKDITIEDKQILLTVLNRIGKDQSFEKRYIGFK